MEDKLRKLFDYQKFDENESLQKVIDGVKARSRFVVLSDEALDNVAAAGISWVEGDQDSVINPETLNGKINGGS